MIKAKAKVGWRVFFCLFGSALAFVSDAALITWDGGGANDNWSSGNNWNPNGNPAANSDLFMDGSLRLTNLLDGSAAHQFNSITFGPNTGGSFLIGGGVLTNGGGGINQYDLNHIQQMTNTTIVLSASQPWNVNSNGFTVFSDLNLSSSTLTITNSSTVILGGLISGTGGIAKNGTGNLFITNSGVNNTFTGDLVINAGTIKMHGNAAGDDLTAGNVIIGDGVGGTAADVLEYGGNGNHLVNTASVTVNSSGMWNLGTVNETFRTLVMSGGVVTNTGPTSVITVVSAITGSVASATSTIAGPGLLRLNGGTVTFEIADGSPADDLLVAMSITNGSLIKSGAGTLVFSRTNWQDGVSIIREGTLVLDGSDRGLGDTTSGTIVSNGASLAFRGSLNYTTAETITNIGAGVNNMGSIYNYSGNNAFAGNVVLGGNASIGTSNGTLTLSGTLVNGGFGLTVTNVTGTTLTASGVMSGTGSLSHNGAGTLVLSGANTYSGGTTNLGGTLESQNATGLGTGDIVLNGGTLSITTVSQNYAQKLILNGNSTLNVATGITNIVGDAVNDVTGSGLLTKTGGGTLVLTFNNNNSGGITINAGAVSALTAASMGTGTVTLNGGELFNPDTVTYSNPLSVIADSVVSGTNGIDVVFSSSSISIMAGTTLYSTNYGGAGRSLTFLGQNMVLAGDIQIGDDSKLKFNHTAGTNYMTGSIKGTGQIAAGIGSVSMIGNGGALVLSNANTYTGTTFASNGTLIVAHDNALGTTAGATLIRPGNATLAFMGGFDYTSAEVITNLGGVGRSGQGSINNISGTNSFAGLIVFGADGTLGTAANKLTQSGGITNGGFMVSVTNQGSSTLVISGTIAGTGGLTHFGSGDLTLSAANTFSGAFTNLSGTVEVSHATALTTASSLSVAGGTLLYNVGNTNTGLTVALSGGIIQEIDQNISLGALTLSGNSAMVLNSGGASGSLRFTSGTNTVGAGAVLTVYGWGYNSATGGGSDDLIFFTSTTFESASFLNNVTFFGLGPGARLLSTGELVPITPEPETWLFGFLVSVGLFWFWKVKLPDFSRSG